MTTSYDDEPMPKAADPNPTLGGSLERLTERAVRLHKLAEEVRARLDPVLRPETTATSPGDLSVAGPARAQLLLAAEGISRELDGVEEVLGDIMARAQV